ncbi:LysR substrate binding domain-containing protein [Bradyrhizobium sp. Ghvi]|uniref:LysR substrate-binding domain-containing protein n=1 Tax=Bradyrhizobium sp. Ghvi TaxID=1855319 RepID=UPI0008F1D982|nr:LysR substrate-binding domain-containing protein [Bradyrhizobium sp. Ghvi]SFO32255.1 LysR substrate binding domain-containing protein [Bradyrhizobium sp. Ghvi]
MVLTPRGAALREPLRHALQRLQAVVSAPPAFDAATSERTFSLGANDNAGAIIGTRLIQRLRKGISPGTRLALRAADSSALVGHLEAGDIDIALVSQAGLPKSLPHQPLLYEKFMMAQRKRHPRGERKPTLRDYARLDRRLR